MAQTLPTSKTPPSGKTGSDPEPPLIDLPGITETPPPGGLEQIGDTPLWGSPVEPVEPTDCERWPNSPYCGGNPVGDKLVDLGVDLSSDSCSVCISIQPTLGLISLPPLIYCYIKPECLIKENTPFSQHCLNIDNYLDFIEELHRKVEQENYSPDLKDIPPICPPPFEGIEGDGSKTVEIKIIIVDAGKSYQWSNGQGADYPPRNSQYQYAVVYGKNDFKLIESWPYESLSDAGTIYGAFGSQQDFLTLNSGTGARIYRNSEGILLPIPSSSGSVFYTRGTDNGYQTFLSHGCNSVAVKILIDNVEYTTPPPKLAEIPTTPREPQMKCNCDRIEEMLRLLLKRVGKPTTITTPNKDKVKKQKVASLSEAVTKWSEAQSTDFSEVYKVVEPRSFEKASYPMSLTHPGAKGDKPIRNFLQAWEVILRQVDKVNGAFPFKIHIKDTNPAQKGDQSLDLEVWSIADAFKLIIQNIVDTEGDVDISNNLLVRIGSMLIQQHQALAKINATTQNTEEFLDYKVKQKVISIPSTLNPLLPPDNQGFGQAKKIDENTEQAIESMMPHFMKNTYLKVKITELDEKRLLGERLYSIEKHATNAAAGNTVHYGGEGTLKKLIEGAMQIAEMEDYLQRENIRKAIGKDKTELKDFEKQVEQGYPEAIGKKEADPEKPYGRPQSKAPKIKRTKRMK